MQVAIEDGTELAASIAKVEAGEHVVLTRQGVAVARIVPMEEFSPVPPPRLQGREREEAVQELKRLLTIGIPLGGVAPTKDEMHERD